MNNKFPIKPLCFAIVSAIALPGCGGNSSGGDTLPAINRSVTTEPLTACIDSNSNKQCDDGDVTTPQNTSGETGLAASAGTNVLVEEYNQKNERSLLLMSEAGSSVANGQSTLLNCLASQGELTDSTAAIISSFSNEELESGIRAALQAIPIAETALQLYTREVIAQSTSSPVLPEFQPRIHSETPIASWQSNESSDTLRHLSSQGSQVLNNTETNRLYLFDATSADVESTSVDLIPVDSWSLSTTDHWMRKGISWLRQSLNVVIDTASAATAIEGDITDGSVVVLEPGQGITDTIIVNQGREALVLMNLKNNQMTDPACRDNTTSVSEGIFRVSLTDRDNIRSLGLVPGCVHSGFSLLASDAAGKHVAAWDGQAGELWLFDGSQLQLQKRLSLTFNSETPPQVLAVSPGGQFLAVVAYGTVAMIDLAKGQVMHTLTADWKSVTDALFIEGGRKLLVASGSSVHSMSLNHSLQPIQQDVLTTTAASQPLRSLIAGPGGDHFLALNDESALWLSSTGKTLTSTAVQPGLHVQRATLADNELVILARSRLDQTFNVLRYSIDTLPTPAESQ